ncbi:MAG: bifunctional UDP-sugar hydrolase/5'-nucleotidase [Myxococcota bacterium]
MRVARHLCLLALLSHCGAPPPPVAPRTITAPSLEGRTHRDVALTVVGTADLHGHLERLPLLDGYLSAMRAMGPVVLIDAGDMWQGTLASNSAEGAPVVAAYNALGYDAAAIGNHEFDYGPVGPSATSTEEDHRRRGALLQRVAEADFPVLSANLAMLASGEDPDWPGVSRRVLIERGGLKVGIIGVTTEETLSTTIAANVNDLLVRPLAESIAAEARALRDEGAEVILVAAHAGGECEALELHASEDGTGGLGDAHDASDLSSCDEESEIFRVARALPEGLVHVIVAGHTHKGLAHEVNGIAVVSAWSLGRAFSRVDLRRSATGFRAEIHRPVILCTSPPCAYAGATIRESESLRELVSPSLAAADELLAEPLGPTISAPFERNYSGEATAGNLLADALRATRPNADVALLNAGGVRASFPAGALTYGALYEAFPFDNRFASVQLTAGELGAILAENARSEGGALIVSGVRADVQCGGVTLRSPQGAAMPDDRALTLTTSDYLATTPVFRNLSDGSVTIEPSAELIREAIADHFREVGGETLNPADYLDADAPRIRWASPRPMSCE